MPDFLLEPDEVEPERPERHRPVRLVASGLADTAQTLERGLSQLRPLPDPAEVLEAWLSQLVTLYAQGNPVCGPAWVPGHFRDFRQMARKQRFTAQRVIAPDMTTSEDP